MPMLASSTYNFFLPFTSVPCVNRIKGGARQYFIFTLADSAISYGGSGNDVLCLSALCILSSVILYLIYEVK